MFNKKNNGYTPEQFALAMQNNKAVNSSTYLSGFKSTFDPVTEETKMVPQYAITKYDPLKGYGTSGYTSSGLIAAAAKMSNPGAYAGEDSKSSEFAAATAKVPQFALDMAANRQAVAEATPVLANPNPLSSSGGTTKTETPEPTTQPAPTTQPEVLATTEPPTPTVAPEGGASGTGAEAVTDTGTGTATGNGAETEDNTSGYTEDEYKKLMTEAKEWGLGQGVNYEAQRDEQIVAVNSEHERNLATYGQRAEQLAQAGLTGSGFSDNMTRDAYAAKQQALAEIEKTYRGNEEGLIAAYKTYLEGQDGTNTQKQTQANAALSTILSENEGITTEAAKQQLLALGYTEEEANNALSSHQNLVVTMQTELGNRCTLAVSNESEAEKFLASLGVTPAEGQSVGDAVFAAIDTLYANEKISETKYNEICLAELQDTLKDNGGNVNAIAEIAAKINLGEGNIGTDANKAAAFAEVCKALGISEEGIHLKDETSQSPTTGNTTGAVKLYLDKDERFSVSGEEIKSPPSTEENMYLSGDYIYKKYGHSWYRFDLTKSNGGKTDEQKAGLGAAVASLFEDKSIVQVLNSEKAGQLGWAGGTFENREYDNGRIRVNGTAYNFEMAEEVAEADVEKLNAALKSQHGREPQPGDALCFNGKIVVVCEGGGLRYIKERTSKNYKTIPGVND